MVGWVMLTWLVARRAQKLNKLINLRKENRIRSVSLPVIPTLGLERLVEEASSESGGGGGGGGRGSDAGGVAGHAFAPAFAGRYTPQHRPVGVRGLTQLDSTDGGSDSDSSGRLAGAVAAGGAAAVDATTTEDSESLSVRQLTDRIVNRSRSHTEAEESAESSMRPESRSRAGSAVSETDSPRSEEFCAKAESEDRYAFAKGFGQPVGLKRLYTKRN